MRVLVIHLILLVFFFSWYKIAVLTYKDPAGQKKLVNMFASDLLIGSLHLVRRFQLKKSYEIKLDFIACFYSVRGQTQTLWK